MPDDLEQITVHERIDALEARIDALEAQIEDTQTTVNGTLDHYDASVLDGLEPGQLLSLEGLQTRYRKAGIVQQSTIKQRIKRLTSLDYFSRDGRTWRFEGVEDE